VRFELTVPFDTSVFKTGAINQTLPRFHQCKYPMFLCYYPDFPTAKATLSLPLERLISKTNERESYFMGRSAKLNWLVNDLRDQPIHKPILLDPQGKTITGDTRLWACDILEISSIPTLIYQAQPGGQVIDGLDQFYSITDVPITSTVSWGPSHRDFFTQPVDNYNVYHQESSDMTGGYQSHRMFISLEDRHWRTRVMWNYLNQNPEIVIDRSWYKRSISWKDYY
jgi:hypothetical protein